MTEVILYHIHSRLQFYVLVIVRCRSKMISETQNMFALLLSKVT